MINPSYVLGPVHLGWVSYCDANSVRLTQYLHIVHIMGYVVADGKSNWLQGVILISTYRACLLTNTVLNLAAGLYIIIAVTFWFYPGKCGVNGHDNIE